jgi:hypothetical protein
MTHDGYDHLRDSADASEPPADLRALRDDVVAAMPWYDSAEPDYTELDAVLRAALSGANEPYSVVSLAIDRLAEASREQAAATDRWIAFNRDRMAADAELTKANLELNALYQEQTRLTIQKVTLDLRAAEDAAEGQRILREFAERQAPR